jgi:hypothetical protein
MRTASAICLSLGLLAGGLLAGCTEKTETGYEPRRLDMSDGDRRALYASPFSPESKAGEHEKQDQLETQAPGHQGL